MSEPLDRAWRTERATVVSVLARRLGDLQLAEDCTQEAFAIAIEKWPVDGVPDRPGAWLTVVAWRRALDVLRRERPEVSIEEVAELGDGHAVDDAHEESLPEVEDDRLALILACCHPALEINVRVALTLRHVAGLTTREIATALLTGEPALSKRMVRARAKLKEGGVSFEVPSRENLEDRIESARAVISLIFTEGHHASGEGPPVRNELCDEAIWLARQLHQLSDDDETTGLLAQLLLTHSRRAARQDSSGDLVLFDDQDRGLWDRQMIEEAAGLLATTGGSRPGRYQLQAAIALVEAREDPIPWQHVMALYRVLLRIDQSPAVALQYAVVVGRARGPEAGLELIEQLADDPRLAGGVQFHAAKADLLEQVGRPAEARESWIRAADLCANPVQREALLKRTAG